MPQFWSRRMDRVVTSPAEKPSAACTVVCCTVQSDGWHRLCLRAGQLLCSLAGMRLRGGGSCSSLPRLGPRPTLPKTPLLTAHLGNDAQALSVVLSQLGLVIQVVLLCRAGWGSSEGWGSEVCQQVAVRAVGNQRAAALLLDVNAWLAAAGDHGAAENQPQPCRPLPGQPRAIIHILRHGLVTCC